MPAGWSPALCPASALQHLLTRWRIEAEGAGRSISRMIVAYEAGRDGFWRLL
jgi:transposase